MQNAAETFLLVDTVHCEGGGVDVHVRLQPFRERISAVLYLFLGQRVEECRCERAVAGPPCRCCTYTGRDSDVRRTTYPIVTNTYTHN